MDNKEVAVQLALGTLELHAVYNHEKHELVGIFSSLEKCRDYVKSCPFPDENCTPLSKAYMIVPYKLDCNLNNGLGAGTGGNVINDPPEFWNLCAITPKYEWQIGRR